MIMQYKLELQFYKERCIRSDNFTNTGCVATRSDNFTKRSYELQLGATVLQREVMRCNTERQMVFVSIRQNDNFTRKVMRCNLE